MNYGEIDGNTAFGQKPLAGSKEYWEREAKIFESELKNERARNLELGIIAQELVVAITHVCDFGEESRVGMALAKYEAYEQKEAERLKAVIGAFGYENKDSQDLE